ncbi:serine hydrolase domain-containing protein [Nocardia suismassiliense]|uniref:serine hydrolase domain-containing protein n=1 Tax=Nocardia suismassiliense TaxID=2077092 RepID=UPI00131EE912|nr:serine hydrolase domain-containing protein [Nocardia suismassiliense]
MVATVLVSCESYDECGPDASCHPTLPTDAAGEIDETVRKFMDAGLIPGALVAVHDPARGSYTKAYGVADLATGRAMTVDDHVRIGSVTKTFTATAVLRAADEGKLSLDDTLSKYVSGIPNGDTIALRDLLGMRGGVWDLTEDVEYISQFSAKAPGAWHDGDRLRAIIEHPESAKPPHTNTEYSNSEFYLLGLVLEKVTGKPVREVLNEVATAHGLHNTSYPTEATIPDPASRGYAYFEDTATDVTARNTPELSGAAGSMVSTIGDLTRYAPLLARGDLLKPETLQVRMQFTTGTASGASFEYGLGVQRIGPYLGHTGGVLGYTTHFGYLPERGITVAVVVNQYTIPRTLLRITASSIWGALVRQLYPESLPGNTPAPTATAPAQPSLADLSAQLQQVFDTKIPASQKTLHALDEDKDPELLTRLASTYAEYPMTIQVDKLTQVDNHTLFATTTTTFAGDKRPMVVPFTARDNTWRLTTAWICESLIAESPPSPACT